MPEKIAENRLVLYSFRRCPYAMRARMGLYKAEIMPVIREIALKNKPPEMLEASPKGTVPVLVLPDNTVIEESLDIMRWALSQNDPDNWLTEDPQETEALIAHNDGPFKQALDRYKYPARYPGEDCSGARDVCERTLRALGARLSNKSNLLAERPSLADIAIFPFVRQCAHVDKGWFDELPVPQLQAWLARYLESPLFQAVMIKLPLWQPGDRPTIFGETTT